MGTAVATASPGSPRHLLAARALVTLLAVAPWLGLLARSADPVAYGALPLAGHVVALLAALHGLGLLVGWAAGWRAGAALAMQWGTAAALALGGGLMALGVFAAPAQLALLFLGIIAHSAELALGARRHAASLAAALAGPRLARWSLLLALVAAVAALHILGGAGAIARSPWDGETNLLGQVRLLADTGGLGDAVGFPRAQALGGTAVLASLAGLGEPAWARMFDDGLGLTLFLLLAVSRLGAHVEHGGLWAGLLVLVATTLAKVVPDASPFWIPAGLLVAAAISLRGKTRVSGAPDGSGSDPESESDSDPDPDPDSDPESDPNGVHVAPRHAIPAVLLAASLAVLHHSFSPCALVLLIAALWPHRRRTGSLPALAALALATVAPYIIARALAASDLPAAALALATPRTGFSFGRAHFIFSLAVALVSVAIFAAAGVLDRRGAPSCLLGLAGRTGAIPAPLPLPLPAALLSLLLCITLYEGQEGRGPARWSYRYAELTEASGYTLSTGAAAPPSPANAALAHIPPGATVALWLGHPERLDHRYHRLLDLRVPTIARLRQRGGGRFERLLTALVARDAGGERGSYFLYDEPLPERTTLAGRLCLLWRPLCDDELSALARQYPTVWTGEGQRVLRLVP